MIKKKLIKKKGKKLVATLTTDNEGNAFSSMKNGNGKKSK